MDTNLTYLSIDGQIEKLKNQGLIIENEDIAKQALRSYGYSNLIKGYRDPYTVRNCDPIQYKDDISFDQITSLYLLDKNLRISILAALLDFEELLDEVVADIVSSSFGITPNEYLKATNYHSRKCKPQFSRAAVLRSLRDLLLTKKEPIAYYRDVRGNVPPWILFKSAYLTTVINLVALLKPEKQYQIATRLFNFNTQRFDGSLSNSHICKYMRDSLFVLTEYRNQAAHGGKIYNYIPQSNIDYSFLPNIHANELPSGLSQFLLILSSLNYEIPFEIVNGTLNRELTRHCKKYPQDKAFLEIILDIKIYEKLSQIHSQ